MSRIIDLTQNRPLTIRVEEEDTGDLLFTVYAKRRLNRQQAMETTKKVGKNREARDVADLEALYRKTIGKIVLPAGRLFKIELPNGDFKVLGSDEEDVAVENTIDIACLLVALPVRDADKIDEAVFGMSFLGDDRGNA